jgi:hypothetical protein
LSRAWLVLVIGLFAMPDARADDAPPQPAAPAADAQPMQIGRSIVVVNDVDGQYGDAPAKRIAVNDDILFAEDITTGADAKTVLEFRDGSTFELGPDAVVRIDSFIFNPEESTSHKAIQVTQGVFRYVSGYVASDQDTKITTPAGAMGIRGSVVEGIVDPSVPNFVYVGEGNATFTNSAGSSDIAAGGAIAVPSNTTPPMAPSAMPDAVAAQAVGVIEQRLPPRAPARPAAEEAWLKQTGGADLVPATAQREREAAIAARPMPSPGARGSMAGELGMLVEGNRIGLFRGGQAVRTPEQRAFMAQVLHDHPGAAGEMRRYRDQAQAMHRTSMAEGTALVIHGVGRAAPSVEVMRRVTAAAVRANPGAAHDINRHASEAYRGPDRGELIRRPEDRRFEEHRPEPRRAEPRGPGPNRDQHASARPRSPAPLQHDVGTRPPRQPPPERGRRRDDDRH